jgi:hypothetical protein
MTFLPRKDEKLFVRARSRIGSRGVAVEDLFFSLEVAPNSVASAFHKYAQTLIEVQNNPLIFVNGPFADSLR